MENSKNRCKKSPAKSNLECWQNCLRFSVVFHCSFFSFSMVLIVFFTSFFFDISLVLNNLHALFFACHCFLSLVFDSRGFWFSFSCSFDFLSCSFVFLWFFCGFLWLSLVITCFSLFPQQRKLRGSSAQNSSGVHWCRRRVRFNEVPEKVLEKVWETGFRRRFWRRFRRRSGRLWCKAKSGSTGFRRRFQSRSARLWCRARSGSTGFRFRRRFRSRSARLWCRARSGSTGSGERLRRRSRRRFWESLVQGQVRFNGFRRRFRRSLFFFFLFFENVCKNKMLRLLGIPPKLIFSIYFLGWEILKNMTWLCIKQWSPNTNHLTVRTASIFLGYHPLGGWHVPVELPSSTKRRQMRSENLLLKRLYDGVMTHQSWACLDFEITTCYIQS